MNFVEKIIFSVAIAVAIIALCFYTVDAGPSAEFQSGSTETVEEKAYWTYDDIKYECNLNLIEAGATVIGYIGSNNEITIPNTVNIPDKGITIKVTTIGTHFNSSSEIIKINLPENVDTISNGAFQVLTSIREINLENVSYVGDYAFYLSDITSAVLSKVKTIGDFAFYTCNNLSEVTFPETDFYIGNFAFAYSNRITDIFIKGAVHIGKNAFEATYTTVTSLVVRPLPVDYEIFNNRPILTLTSDGNKDVLYLKDSFFNTLDLSATEYIEFRSPVEFKSGLIGSKSPSFSHLKTSSLKINWTAVSNYMTTLDEQSFYGCYQLAHADLSSVGGIGSYSFYECDLQDVIFSKSGYWIEDHAFDENYHLQNIDLSHATSISGKTFGLQKTQSLKPFYIDTYVIAKHSALNGGIFHNRAIITMTFVEEDTHQDFNSHWFTTSHNSTIETLIINFNVSYFRNLFNNLGTIKTVEFNGIYKNNQSFEIEKSAFENCSSLNDVKFPRTASEIIIGDDAFRGCANIISPDVTASKRISVGAAAYTDCINLKSIRLFAPTIDTMREAFKNCTKLIDVKSNGRINIDNYAFENCRSLTTVEGKVISVGYKGFLQCPNIANIDLSEASSIGGEAFSHCEKLTNIDLSKVKSTGDYCFSVENKTDTHVIMNNTNHVGLSIFKNRSIITITIVDSENSYIDFNKGIMTGAVISNLESLTVTANIRNFNASFSSINTLKSVEFCGRYSGSQTLVIGPSAFSNSKALEKLILPTTGSYRIEAGAFMYCSALKEIDISRADYVDNNAFSLMKTDAVSTTLKLNASATIRNDAFYMRNIVGTLTITGSDTGVISPAMFGGADLSGLKDIAVEGNIFAIGFGPVKLPSLVSIEFNGDYSTSNHLSFTSMGFMDATNLKSIKLPANCSITIGDYAFSGCRSLTAFDHDRILSIGNNAFERSGLKAYSFNNAPVNGLGGYIFKNCTELENVVLYRTFKTIPTGTFSGCVNLVECATPVGIETIGSFAFENCESLKSIHLPSTLLDLQDDSFRGAGISSVFIPSKKLFENLGAVFDIENLELIMVEKHNRYAGTNVIHYEVIDFECSPYIILNGNIATVHMNGNADMGFTVIDIENVGMTSDGDVIIPVTSFKPDAEIIFFVNANDTKTDTSEYTVPIIAIIGIIIVGPVAAILIRHR